MDPSFSNRVQDIFGSLKATLQASPLLNSETEASTTFWTVSGPQARVHAKQRNVPIDLGISSGEFEMDIDVEVDSDEEDSEEDDYGDEDEEVGVSRASRRKRLVLCGHLKLGVGDENEEEEFESGKRMIGMDDTLDFEEEEDEFDRVAEGIDLGANWLRVKDMSPFQGLTCLVEENRETGVSKGRKSIMSASRRDTAKRSRSSISEGRTSTTGDNRDGVDLPQGAREMDERMPKIPRTSGAMKSALCAGAAVNGERNSTKHVRFAVDEVDESRTEEDRGSGAVTQYVVPTDPEGTSGCSRDRYSTVPDYVKHPTKYTYYSLEWSEEDADATNRAAFKGFQQSTAVTGQLLEAQYTVELPKSLTFISRTKPPNGKELWQQETDADTKMAENQQYPEMLESKRPVVQVTAHLTEEQALEDEPRSGKLERVQSTSENAVDKASRRYRNRGKVTNYERVL